MSYSAAGHERATRMCWLPLRGALFLHYLVALSMLQLRTANEARLSPVVTAVRRFCFSTFCLSVLLFVTGT